MQYQVPALETALMLRLLVRLPLHQIEGFLMSIFRMPIFDPSALDQTTRLNTPREREGNADDDAGGRKTRSAKSD